MPCIFAPSFATATLGVDRYEAGVASAMVNTSQQVGGAVGTAVLSTIFANAASSYASSHARSPGLAASAAVHGYTTAFYVAAGMFAIGLLVAALVLPAPHPARSSSRRASPRPTWPSSGGGADEAALVQQLGDLHGVQRGALEQVVADDEEVQRVRVAEVAADAADGDLVAAGPLQRRRDVVDDEVREAPRAPRSARVEVDLARERRARPRSRGRP